MTNNQFCLKPIWLLVIAIFISFCLNAQIAQPQPAIYNQKLQSATLLFMENKGQVADDKGNLRPDILFTANSGGAKLYLTANSIHYQFTKTDYPKGYDPFSKEPSKNIEKEEVLRKQIKTSTHRFILALQGANQHPTVVKEEQSSYFENYYLAQCPNGITGVHSYEKIIYKNVYPNIDWVIYSKGGFMEYDFLVHPGGNPTNIQLKIKDADSVSITAAGELLMKTSLGEVREKAPVSYADGVVVESHFKQLGDGTIGFDVQPSPGRELRIDPSIVWSTYYGGSSHEGGCYAAVDGSGNVYLNGLTWTTSGLASGGFQNTYGGGFSDVFLVKFNSSGNRLWATYYGGNDEDYPSAFTTDLSGNVYLSGGTKSSGGIASGGFQNVYAGGGGDAFLVKFNGNGSRIWGTYFGGDGLDNASCCVVDASGNIYLTGSTASSTGIANGGFQNVYGGSTDAFLLKLSSNGSRLWSTYYGGTGSDGGASCAVDANSNVYVAGGSQSSTIIASGGFQNTFAGLGDAMLVKFNSSGNRIWATYYGGTGSEIGSCCCVDNNDNVYLCGSTTSLSNIAFGGFQNSHGNSGGYDNDAYLVKFSSAGNRLWATYYGGIGRENFSYCTTNAVGSVYLAGQTESSVGIAFNGFQNSISTSIGADSYIVKFTSSGSRVWGSYFGGLSYEQSGACIADNIGNVYISGHTGSGAGIALNGFQNTIGGVYDGYLAKIADEVLCIAGTVPTITATPDTICSGSSTLLNITSGNLNSATAWQWHKDSCTGASVGSGTSITVSPTVTTTYYVRGEGGCATPGNCASKTITVNPVLMPTVALTANPAGTIIAGTQVTFTATPTNAGTSPSFAFKINGTNVQNGSLSYYTTNTLNNGDVVTVTLTSNAFCTSTPTATSNAITMVVAAPCIAPAFPVIQAASDTICAGSAATINITSGNLNSAAQWTWRKDSCNGPIAGTGTTISVSPLTTTTYYIRGEGGCVIPGNCATRTITVNIPPVVSFAATPSSVCSGDTVSVAFTGNAAAMPNYLWNWGGGNVVSGNGAGPYKVIYTASSTISLSVTSGRCSVAATPQSIVVTQSPEATFIASDSVGCNGLAVLFTNTSQTGSAWQWNFGDGTLSNMVAPPIHQYTTGFYTASLTVTNGQCSHTSAPKPIRVINGPVARFLTVPDISTPVQLSKAKFSFTNTSQNATRYLWRFTNADSSAIQNPSYQFKSAGSYTVSLYAYNDIGCADTFTMKPFIIVADSALNIPNAFSPNNDGINDTWMINGLQGNAKSKVTIFNRWGQRIFTSTGYNNPWDGNYNGKPLPVDTYYYIITANDKRFSGSVFLLR